jgi:putative membrane protein
VTHQHGGGAALLLAVLALAIGYEVSTLRIGRHRPWSPWRSTSFMIGCLLLLVALAPGQPADFPTHVRQHLIVGMLAPTALVLGAPLTLLLRILPAPTARRLTRTLHLRPVRLIAHPAIALILSSGSLTVLHLTPLHARLTADPVLHNALLVHFLLSGWLFAWVIAGPDPAPRRPSVRYRLVVLGCAVVTHAVLSQLLYAGVIGDPAVPDSQRRAGATLLYYGADAAELLLAFALVTTRRALPRRSRRTQSGPARSVPVPVQGDRAERD